MDFYSVASSRPFFTNGKLYLGCVRIEYISTAGACAKSYLNLSSLQKKKNSKT